MRRRQERTGIDTVVIGGGLKNYTLEVPKMPAWRDPILRYNRLGRRVLGVLMLAALFQGVVKDGAVNDLSNQAVRNINPTALTHIDKLAEYHKVSKGQVITMLENNAGQQFSKDVAVFTSDQQTLEDDAAEIGGALAGVGALALGSLATRLLSKRLLRKRQKQFRENLATYGGEPEDLALIEQLNAQAPARRKKHNRTPLGLALKGAVAAGVAVVGASVVAPGLFTKAITSVGRTVDNFTDFHLPEKAVNDVEASQATKIESELTTEYWNLLPDVSKYLDASKLDFQSYIINGFQSSSNPPLNIVGNFVNDIRYIDGHIAPQYYFATSTSNPNWDDGAPIDATAAAFAGIATVGEVIRRRTLADRAALATTSAGN